MNVHQTRLEEERRGQATFGMANLRANRTGLPFVVFISQKGGAKHDVRVKVASGPKVRDEEMGTYRLRPFSHAGGYRLSSHDEVLLQAWIERNMTVLVGYWDGEIEYTEDAIEQLKPL